VKNEILNGGTCKFQNETIFSCPHLKPTPFSMPRISTLYQLYSTHGKEVSPGQRIGVIVSEWQREGI
jgi:hypothetical protein